MTAGGTASTEALTRALATRPDAELAELLEERPDLAAPAPSSLTALGTRAASRPSVERALALLDELHLTVLESLAALSALGPAGPEELAGATGVPAATVRTVLGRADRLGLVVDGLPVAALVEALGPHPAGLGPALADLPLPTGTADQVPTGTADLSLPTGTADRVPTGAASTSAQALTALLDSAPPDARRTLDALVWGPPVGTLGSSGRSPGVQWLLDHGLLRPLSATQLALPMEVGLAARGGRTHRDVTLEPPAAGMPVRPAAVVAAEGARAAEETVRLVATLLTAWGHEPPVALRNGGLGVRELRRAAGLLEVEQPEAATVVELAGMAGLVAPYETGEESLWAPTLGAADWLEDSLTGRWAELATAWAGSARTPWLVGTRNDRGALRATLEPGLERGWARRLRRRALGALAELAEGSAPSTAQLHALLRWHAPRATPPEPPVAAVLAEAATLGLTGAGALTRAGRALLEDADVAAALAADLPEPVNELLVQGDLTGVVPGRPAPELGALLDRASDVESRGSALTVRFTAASVRRALDAGMSGTELLDALREFSRTPLPQPLEYLITDTARRHGQVRVGAAGSYVQVTDAAAAAELQSHPDLALLQLRAVAPTVLVSPARPAELLDGLRTAGAAPVLDGSVGSVVTGGPRRTVAPRRGRSLPSGGRDHRGGDPAPVQVRRPGRADLLDLVGRMREAEERARRTAAERTADGRPARTDPVHALAVLREAARAGAAVEVVMVGAGGRPQRRRVLPLSVDAGRVRMRDVQREAEITVAVHRISAVTPA